MGKSVINLRCVLCAGLCFYGLLSVERGEITYTFIYCIQSAVVCPVMHSCCVM